jgi:hypothetical protein
LCALALPRLPLLALHSSVLVMIYHDQSHVPKDQVLGIPNIWSDSDSSVLVRIVELGGCRWLGISG